MKNFFASRFTFAAVLTLFLSALSWNVANGAQSLQVAHGPIMCDGCVQVAHGPIMCDGCAQVAHGPIMCDGCVQVRPHPEIAPAGPRSWEV
ncbi:MAG TPA: hypothetical protein VMH28_26600 [Candidatus Acidoferrales bacterium]|nr:hypothetical protein [Candidatus Acidoferrales bacterium]